MGLLRGFSFFLTGPFCQQGLGFGVQGLGFRVFGV